MLLKLFFYKFSVKFKSFSFPYVFFHFKRFHEIVYLLFQSIFEFKPTCAILSCGPHQLCNDLRRACECIPGFESRDGSCVPGCSLINCEKGQFCDPKSLTCKCLPGIFPEFLRPRIQIFFFTKVDQNWGVSWERPKNVSPYLIKKILPVRAG